MQSMCQTVNIVLPLTNRRELEYLWKSDRATRVGRRQAAAYE